MASVRDTTAASVAGKTVLLVEDDVLVRLDLAQELRARGVAVIEAMDVQQATKVLESARRIDLVFSDVQMPGAMDGAVLAWIRLRRPGVKVMLTSTHVPAGRRIGLERGAVVIDKPYHTASVAGRIVRDLAQAH